MDQERDLYSGFRNTYKHHNQYNIMVTNYSFWVGLGKSLKNSAIIILPAAILNVLASVPVEYAWIVSPFVYLIKNYVDNK